MTFHDIRVGDRVAVKTGAPLYVITGTVTELIDDKYHPYLVKLDIRWSMSEEVAFSLSDVVYHKGVPIWHQTS